MPELPDILLYLDALRPRVVGRRIEHFRVLSPFVLRTFQPPADAVHGRTVREITRSGKRFVFCLDGPGELSIVVHLMIAGRWRWADDGTARGPGKITLASLVLEAGALHLVESGTKKRASVHVLSGTAALTALDRGGLDVLSAPPEAFAARLRSENHTLKRSLTDPRLFDGVGNAYSDEILHAARLSPVKLTQRLEDDEIRRLHLAAGEVLTRWVDRLRAEFAGRFPGPGDVTAFRADFAVHGRFGKPCPDCGTAVQRIRYAEDETNYCPRCQTGGVVLADRSLSRLLKRDWPRTIEEWESGLGP